MKDEHRDKGFILDEHLRRCCRSRKVQPPSGDLYVLVADFLLGQGSSAGIPPNLALST